ncbi:hypothetical protein PEBR_33990 [Penicillium brasilianum]|uniref:J domain-containing protein n=1 Tax=Penicillium brasilianum TaxID=104259 RepID=A0A1S9RGU1_PENBI|nr:hypothetical protein PEBR_33990 [Penicillium brasilianum]
MTSTSQEPDYYEVLQVSRDADSKTIASSYKRLALTTHPDKNTAKNANAAFQLLHEAYSVLLDPNTRQAYDAKCHTFKSASARHSASQPNGERPNNSKEKDTDKDLESKLRQCKDEIRNSKRRLDVARERMLRLCTDIARLNNEIHLMEQEKAYTGQVMWNYLISFLPGRVTRLEQQKQDQDRSYRERLAARRIKDAEQSTLHAEIQALGRLVDSHVGQAFKIELEIRRRKEEAVNILQEAYLRHLAKIRAERESTKRAQAQERTQHTSQRVVCEHKAWWMKVEGRFRCSRCLTETRRFAFKCPGCDKIACASCRESLKRGYGWS